MKRLQLSLSALGLVSLLVIGTSLSGARADDHTIDIVDVTDHFPSDPPLVFGTSELLRTDEGIAYKLDTTGLVAGTGYTLWMFIDESDASIGGPPGLAPFELRIQMGGSFAAPDGSGQFSAFLPAGALPAANGMTVLAIDDGSFDDPEGADVLLLVRWHGPAESGFEYEQTHFINGGSVDNVSVQEAFHIGDDDEPGGLPWPGHRGQDARARSGPMDRRVALDCLAASEYPAVAATLRAGDRFLPASRGRHAALEGRLGSPRAKSAE